MGIFEFALDESTVDEDRLAAVVRIERSDEVISQLCFAGSRLDEDLLGVIEPASQFDFSILKLRDDFRIDMFGQANRLESHLVLQVFDQVFLPAQALDLPSTEGKGEDGDGDEDEGHGCPSPVDARLPGGCVQRLSESARLAPGPTGPVRRTREAAKSTACES